VEGETRPIPTLASIPNRLSGKGFVAKKSIPDTKTDTIFPTPLETSVTGAYLPDTR
jgi:hypothetical protein